ncbi:MAG: type IX secretion system membrane protein PorP/SprF [Bacteroidetes bacterium]|nr:MAG: type IX secretion system membrane protein PorP/SprF [Bacteroidota bacterium]
MAPVAGSLPVICKSSDDGFLSTIFERFVVLIVDAPEHALPTYSIINITLITKALLIQKKNKMKQALTILGLFLLCGQIGFGQQDPMFTKYMCNSLIFNPAYAGSKQHMYIGALHRTQWYEINGAPTTQSFTLHTPLRNDRVAVGMSVVNDKIGPTNNLGANLVYAYRIPLSKKEDGLKLSIGLQAGIENYRADWSKLTLENPGDPPFMEDENRMLPNFGAGLYLYNQHFYLGASSPQLVEYDLRDNIQTNFYARQARHYYLMGGAAIPLNGRALIFKPSFLLKNVGLFKSQSKLTEFKDIGAPSELDIDLSLLFQETLWIGASFRTALEVFQNKSSYDSADIWVSVFLKNGMRIGAAYDYPLTELSNVTTGAFEVMLGYEFKYNERKVATPRYF